MQNVFPLHRLRLGFASFSQMVTVPILGMNLHPKDRSPSLLHTFQSEDQRPNLNQWKNLAWYRNPCPSSSPTMEISHKTEGVPYLEVIEHMFPCHSTWEATDNKCVRTHLLPPCASCVDVCVLHVLFNRSMFRL